MSCCNPLKVATAKHSVGWPSVTEGTATSRSEQSWLLPEPCCPGKQPWWRDLMFCVLGNSFITWAGKTATPAHLPWWQGHTQTLKDPICVVSDALNCPHLLTKMKCLSVCLSSAGGKRCSLGLTVFQFRLCNSVAQLCPTLCDPMDCSTEAFLVHHQLPEFTQSHIHWVSDAIQPSHPLSPSSPPAPHLIV